MFTRRNRVRGPAIWFCVLGLVLTACSPLAPFTSETIVDSCDSRADPPAEVVGLMVQPDDGLQSFLREIDAATCTIDLSVYILSEPAIIETLGRAALRGVEVRVMLEEHPFGGSGVQQETRDTLASLGIEVRWSGSQTRFSHAKYMVIDGTITVIMNQNLTTAAFTNNRDFALITTFTEEVLQAQIVFDRDWNHDAISDPPGPLILSPSNSRTRMIDIIDGATLSVDFYAEIIRDAEIVAALERAVNRGVVVRLIVDRSSDEEMRGLLAGMVEKGMDVRIAQSLYIHAKMMVVDNQLAIVGSQNPTATSLDENREVSMVVTDPIVLGRAATIFARDWMLSVPFGESGQVGMVSGTKAFQVYRFHNSRDPQTIATAQPARTAC